MQRSLVVSIHDVAPATQSRVARILAQLRESGVPHCSLLVVPDYHRRGRSLGQARFSEWLRELSGQGNEVVLHGFYHERVRWARETVWQRLITRIYTADEGEFYDLGYDEAFTRVCEAKREFAAHGIHPTGFIAPAWLLGGEARRAAVDAGFRYTTTLGAVCDFASGRDFPSQSLVYSTRSSWRRGMSLVWNRALFRHLAERPLLRLSIHPADVEYLSVWRQILDLVAKALFDREPTTYRAWLDSNLEVRPPQSTAIA